jgi:malto-oligosyltrehalose trehalohydrolase
VTTYRVWAPAADTVEVELDGSHRAAMHRAETAGWWLADLPDAAQGAGYSFRLDGGEPLADPRSPWQPHGPAGPSRSYDHSGFRWTDRGWRGRPLAGAIQYELHVGTFTPAGTFDGAIGRLDYLRDLGVDMVEIMPVAAFPGRHGWGYDGIGLWAVHEAYGGPDGLKRLVDACHSRGLAVLLDVVYNHVGPGNRLADFGPYLTDAHTTPWGPAVNLDQPGSDEVRAFLVGNALMWLRDYHLDGLRLDAVHGFKDDRALHFLEELRAEVAALAATLNRELVLIAESDRNDPRLVGAPEAGGYGLGAVWTDDLLYAVAAAITGERAGPHRDFGSLAAIAKALRWVYYHDGTWSSFRGRSHGRPVDVLHTPAHRFVGYLQNHDQVGNRATGDRISDRTTADLVKVGAGLVITAPVTPMLFMGEEWAAATPWQYFTDHTDPRLADTVADGRRSDFAAFGWGDVAIPDPQDEATFLRSKLDWSELACAPHRDMLAWYRELIALRRSQPELTDPRLDRVSAEYNEEERWLLVTRGRLRIVACLSPQPVTVPLGTSALEVLAVSASGVRIAADAVIMPRNTFAVIAT